MPTNRLNADAICRASAFIYFFYLFTMNKQIMTNA